MATQKSGEYEKKQYVTRTSSDHPGRDGFVGVVSSVVVNAFDLLARSRGAMDDADGCGGDIGTG